MNKFTLTLRRRFSLVLLSLLVAFAATSRALTFTPVYTVDPATPTSVQQQQIQATNSALATLATFFQPSNINLRVEFSFRDLGSTGTLGSAGPAGFQAINGLFYAQALFNLISQTDLTGTVTSLSVSMNTNASVNWSYSNTTPAASQYSWQAVIMHEVGHSMGFFDTLNRNGSYYNAGPSIFETMSTLGIGGSPLSSLDQAARAAAIISNNVFWSGQFGLASNNNVPIKLYAPNPYEEGSTYSHIDPSERGKGGIYFPSLADATYFPGPTAQELAIFRDLGWAVTGSATPTPAPSPSPSATPQPTPADVQLVNIATRVAVGTGEQVGIAGFIVNGNLPKKVLIRGIGPTLVPFGIANALPDPLLELRDSTGALIVSNDNWRQFQETEIAATGIAPKDDLEAAIVATLDAGRSYTAIFKGTGTATGIGVVEVFDLAPNAGSELANISTRGQVGVDAKILIGGFIAQGATPQKVAVRAIGPSLAAFGITGVLADPTLELRDAQGALLMANDNWKDDATQAAALTQNKIAPTNDAEAALIAIVPAGNYTAQVRGKDNTTGVAIVEAYNLKPSKPTTLAEFAAANTPAEPTPAHGETP